MLKRCVLCLVVSSMALAGVARSAQDPDLGTGIQQVKEGHFDAALLTLDGVVRRLEGQPGRKTETAQAYLYLGVAYVGLLQEVPARDKFKQALKYDPNLKPDPAEFPPRVIRVFEAAKKGSSKSVLIAGGGIGAAGIAAVALLAGGSLGSVAAVQVGGESPAPGVTPTTRTGAGSISFVSITPAPGSTINGCSNGATCSIAVAFNIVSDATISNVLFTVELMNSAGAVCLEGTSTARFGTIAAGQSTPVGHQSFRSRCTTPFTTSTMRASVLSGTQVVFSQDYNGAVYTLP